MATFNQSATGVWRDGATWGNSSPGVEGTDFPGSGDVANGGNGYDLTVSATVYVYQFTMVNGQLTQNAKIVVDDTAGAFIKFEDDAEYDNGGTYTGPVEIASENNSPSNPWYLQIEHVSGNDTRTLNFKYVKLTGHYYSLGNYNYFIKFNEGGTDDPVLSFIQPSNRGEVLEEHMIEGRSTGRVYDSGRSAGVITISGTASLDSFLSQRLEDMSESRERISLFTRIHHFPRCRIERKSYNDFGGLFYKFSVTLREDL